VIIDDQGGRMFACSDTDYCGARRASGHKGPDPSRVPDAFSGEKGDVR